MLSLLLLDLYQMTLTNIIEDAYRLFSSYTITSSLSICKPHCVSFEKEKELVNTPLRKVPVELLEQAYFESARNFTEQELWEMKHFLPRVMELVSNFEFPCHSWEIVFDRLDLDKTVLWTSEEITLFTQFADSFFEKCLCSYPLPGYEKLTTILIMFGNAEDILRKLLCKWQQAEHDESLLHFKDIMLYGIKSSKGGSYKVTNPFVTEKANDIIVTWLASDEIRQVFAKQIEKKIMANSADSEALEQLSLLYEMVH